MAQVKLLVNGKEIQADEKKAAMRESLLKVAVTANPLAKTPVEAVSKFPNVAALAAALRNLGDADTVIEFYEKPEGKTEYRKAAEYTLPAFAGRLELAANVKAYSGTIFSDGETKEKTAKTEQSFDWE